MLKSMRKSKIAMFYHIFVSRGDAPGAITLSVVWMEKEFDACDVYVGGKVRVLELMRFFYLKHSGSKINFVL